MKLASEIAKESLNPNTTGKVVHMIAVLGGWKALDTPTMSTELSCLICGGSEHYTAIMQMPSPDKVWICANIKCASITGVLSQRNTITPTPQGYAIRWPLFCEINGIGDEHYDVCFEKIEQSPQKIEFLKRFLSAPKGIVLMQGEQGLGKTYAAMGSCEFFCRTNKSCIFQTHQQIYDEWINSFKSDYKSSYFSSVRNCNLLVIDDFGVVVDQSPKFMGFVFEIFNNRLQWTNRGTIITTNLDDKTLGEYCGKALGDRMRTGNKLVFINTGSRRTRIII